MPCARSSACTQAGVPGRIIPTPVQSTPTAGWRGRCCAPRAAFRGGCRWRRRAGGASRPDVVVAWARAPTYASSRFASTCAGAHLGLMGGMDMLVYARGRAISPRGIALRLHRAGLAVVMADIAEPTCIRPHRGVLRVPSAWGEACVEGVCARLAYDAAQARAIADTSDIAVVADPAADMLGETAPDVVVDAIIAKKTSARRSTWPDRHRRGARFHRGRGLPCVRRWRLARPSSRRASMREAPSRTRHPGIIGGHGVRARPARAG